MLMTGYGVSPWCPEINGIPSHLVYGRDSVDIVRRLAVGSALNESLPVNLRFPRDRGGMSYKE